MEKLKQAMRGPIAEKFVGAIDKIQKQKVIDFSAWKTAQDYQSQLQKERENTDLSTLDPLHALYMTVQHRISEFIEQFSMLPDSQNLNKRHDEAEDLYWPIGPPMSPVTKSYFFCWSAFDMNIGIKRETYTTIMMECCKTVGADPNFIHIIKCMQDSRMGLYRHHRYDGKFVYLEELYTDRKFKVYSSSGYHGVAGEIWFVRLLSDPFGYGDYAITFTTPYVIINSRAEAGDLFYKKDDWLEFIERSLIKVKTKDQKVAYDDFMKYGLVKHYWLEYITQAYVNHTENAIWLTGLPDKPETLPHGSK